MAHIGQHGHYAEPADDSDDTTAYHSARADAVTLRAHARAMDLNDLVLQSRRPATLVHGLLLDDTLTMVTGEPYVGKTMFLLDLALGLALRQPIFGRYMPARRAGVLFVGQDAPTWDYAEQVRKLLLGRGIVPGDGDLEHLGLTFLLNQGHTITAPSFHRFLREYHDAVGYDVLMLDSFSDMHGANENDRHEMSVILRCLKDLRDTLGVAVIFTHHTAKPTQLGQRSKGQPIVSYNYQARGSSAIVASIDFNILLTASAEGRISLRRPKGRGLKADNSLEEFVMRDRNDGLAIEPLDSLAHIEQLVRPILARDRFAMQRTRIVKEIQPGVAVGWRQLSEAVDVVLCKLEGEGYVKRMGKRWRLAGHSPSEIAVSKPPV
jgi:hypothetical protein